jgi:hypothetical protein
MVWLRIERWLSLPLKGNSKERMSSACMYGTHHRAELGVQPFQFDRVRQAKVVLQRRNVPTAGGPASATPPAFADVGDPADHRANLGAVTVVQLANRTTSKACSAGSAGLVEVLADNL